MTIFVIPGREPTGPREARPDDKLRERTRNPAPYHMPSLDSGSGAPRRPGMNRNEKAP
jgi:hypothetical protein